jgi:XRE family transcriptional regulator, regulator of sulfur utilization
MPLSDVISRDKSDCQPNNTSPITADEEDAIQYVKGVKEFYGHVFMYVVFVAVFGFFFGFKHPLSFWGSLGWGIGKRDR